MRALGNEEKEKRGCMYCIDRKKGECKHKECPYHELDDFETYEDYFKSHDDFFSEFLWEV